MSITKEYTGFLLQSQDYKEADKKITLLTQDGLMYCQLKGVKKSGAKLKAAGLPFACGLYTINTSVITSFVSLYEFDWLSDDYDTFVYANIACEICLHSALGNDCGAILGILLNFFKDILASDVSTAMKTFMKKILTQIGFQKNFEKYTIPMLLAEFETNAEIGLKSTSCLVATPK